MVSWNLVSVGVNRVRELRAQTANSDYGQNIFGHTGFSLVELGFCGPSYGARLILGQATVCNTHTAEMSRVPILVHEDHI